MIYQHTETVILDLWEFFSKWGFGGGDDLAALEAAGQIRDHAVEVLNQHLPPDIRAEVWDDVTSMHNPCLISLTLGEGRDISPAGGIWSDEELFLEQTWPIPELAGVMKQVVAELRAELVQPQTICLPVQQVREVCRAALYALDPGVPRGCNVSFPKRPNSG